MAARVPAHIQSPADIELKQSSVDDKRIGSFCLDELIPKDKEFGPFKGRIVYDKNCEDVDQRFSWEVYDLETFKYLHTVDATDPGEGNWMRYVCCARYFEEQNIVSNQHGAEVYYRALKDIKPGEELLTWFQPKKKRKRSSLRNSIESSLPSGIIKETLSEDTGLGLGKRKRKPKIIPDSYQGPLDFKFSNKPKKPDDDEFEPLQPGQKRRRRKKVKSTTIEDKQHTLASSETNLSQQEANPSADVTGEKEQAAVKLEQSKEPLDKSSDHHIVEDTKSSNEIENLKKLKSTKREKALCLREANKLVDWKFPAKGDEYIFRLKRYHIHHLSKGKKAYKCEICMGLYKQMFSLKRHYLRNHINYKYLSKADIANCSINLKYVKQMMYERSLMNQWKKKKENGEEVDESQNSFFEKLDKTVQSLSNGIMDTKDHNAQDDKDETLKTDKSPSEKDSIEQVTAHDADNCEVKIELDSIDLKMENPDVGSKGDNSKSSSEQKLSLTKESNDFLKESMDLPNTSNEAKISMENIKTENIDDELQEAMDFNENADKLKDQDFTHNLSKVKTENENIENSVLEDVPAQNIEHCKIENENLVNSCLKIEPNNDMSDEEISLSVVQDLKPENTVDDIVKAKMPGLYRCYTCFEAYDTVDEIRKHLEDHPLQALCFACDQCNMRFHFKQNLVRHKKVHEKDNTDEVKKPKTKWAKQMGDDAKILKRLNKKKEKALAMAEPCKIPVIEPKGTSDYVFKCNKCKQIFQNQKTLTDHVQEQHKDGGKFQCQYCGKDFPSMPNMKKHVRFHLGYRVRCRTCSEIFSNVGALRKHIRFVHPEIYKAKRDNKLPKEDSNTVLNNPTGELANNSVNEKSDNLKTEQVKNHIKDSEQDSSEPPKDACKRAEDILSETDITFEAHEIDDGGSRFKFSCSVCKKRFSSYINMRRHRRKVHSGDRQKLEEGLIFTRKSKNITPPVIEDRKELEQFYANVSHNIAINLNCYIDGKSESLEKYTDHIIVEDYQSGSFGYSEHSEQVAIAWEEYNFPPDFIPVQTLTEKQTDFDKSKTPTDLDDDQQSSNLDSSESDRTDYSSDKNCLENHLNHINQDTQAENMGKPSTGIKTIASVGISAVQKITKSLENLMSDSNRPESLVSKLPDRIFSKNSPSTKNFCQVKNGEYANFDDLMLGDDFSTIARDKDECTKDEDRPTRNRAHSSASSRMRNKKPIYKRSHSAGDLLDEEQTPEDMCLRNTSEDLYRESQAELDKLYDSIDMGVEYSPQKLDTPKSLSNLCERMLGLKAATGCRKQETKKDADDIIDNHRKPRASTQLFTNLSLSSNEEKENTVKMFQDLQPDYSDASIDSPFYNYESIAFGKNGDITKVCAVCKTHFDDFDSLLNHHLKNHPLSACNYLEVEDGNDIESLHFAYPTNIGVLAESHSRLSTVSESGLFHCTRCGGVFKSKARLHVHIVNCSPIDPVYGAVKVTSSPVKSPKKQSPAALGQNDMNSHHSSTQKRVFTGCRKRTALLLPDSPIKMSLTDKNIQDIMSGYNPNKHIRRRELTELVDTLTCEACGQKFKTIILLERHVKNCAEKEKFKNVRPLTCPILDESLAKLKNICFYCDKNFTYAKSLINHFQDFCPVKKMKVDRGELTYEDKMREAKIITRLHKQEADKVNKDKDAEGQNKRPWQVGRKPKRKGHSWTYIKKRKQMGANDNEIEGETDAIENDSDESVVNTSIQNGQITPEKSSQKFHDANGNLMVQNKDTTINDSPIEFDEVDSLGSFNEEHVNKDEYENKIVTKEENCSDINKDLSNDQDVYSKAMQQDKSKNISEQNKIFAVADKNIVNNDTISSKEVKEEHKSICGTDEMLGNWNIDANTSLDFTRRYKVNQVSVPRKETTKTLFMQCVTHNEGSPNYTNGRVERSKRKRERCGKVEAFLQNIFKRKKKKEALLQAKEMENNDILQSKVFLEDPKGNISESCNRLTNNEISNIQNDTKLTYISNDFRLNKDEDKKIMYSECFESKREENGNIRYLFKRGRPRKRPLPGKTENSKTRVKETVENHKTKVRNDTVADNTDIRKDLPQKVSDESHTFKEELSTDICTTKRPRGRPRKKTKIWNFIKKTDESCNNFSVQETKKEGNDNEESVKDVVQNNSVEIAQIVKDECTEKVVEHEDTNCFVTNHSDESEPIPNQIFRMKESDSVETTKSLTVSNDDEILNKQSELSVNHISELNEEIIREQISTTCEIEYNGKLLCETETNGLCNKSNSEIAKEQNQGSVIIGITEDRCLERITSETELLILGAHLDSKMNSDNCTVLKQSNVIDEKLNTYTFSEMSEESLLIATENVPSDSKQSLNTESAALSPYDSNDQAKNTKETVTKSNTSNTISSFVDEETEKMSEKSKSGEGNSNRDTEIMWDVNGDTEMVSNLNEDIEISLVEDTSSKCIIEDVGKISSGSNTESDMESEERQNTSVQREFDKTEITVEMKSKKQTEVYLDSFATKNSQQVISKTQNENCIDSINTENNSVPEHESADLHSETSVKIEFEKTNEEYMDSIDTKCDGVLVIESAKSHTDKSVETEFLKKNEDCVRTENIMSVKESTPKADQYDHTKTETDFLSDFYSSVILSPSERVKTNKRSCKKEPSPFSPVWIKQKSKPKTTDHMNSKSVGKLTANEESNKNISDNYVSNIEKQIKESANGNLKDIPKALKRKLEIVRMFDSCKNNSQK